jgi:hypothetical protein
MKPSSREAFPSIAPLPTEWGEEPTLSERSESNGWPKAG